jgi:hypothetical protein
MSVSAGPRRSTYEVTIVEAGVAGLPAATVFGRYKRRTIVIGPPHRENLAALEVHVGGAGQPVADHSAVEDGLHQPLYLAHDLREVRRGGGEQIDRLAEVTPGGGGADAEPGAQAGRGIAVAQVHQHQQGLTSRALAAPAGSAGASMRADEVGQVGQAEGRQRDRGRGRTALREATWARHRILVDCCLTGSVSHPMNSTPTPVIRPHSDQERQDESGSLLNGGW